MDVSRANGNMLMNLYVVVYILDSVVGIVKVFIELTLQLHQYYLQNFLHFIPCINSIIHFNSMKFCKMIWMTFVTHTEEGERKW
jgi:hypothetical protein